MNAPSEDRARVRTQLGINMVVEAGAGTGKTTLLIDRLCFALLAQGVAAVRLVALTFTEKAAVEIKTRLMAKLQSVLRAVRESGEDATLDTLRTYFNVPDTDIIERAELALAQLDRAPIGTIHGFCADILRAYPLEAGLTPNAEIDKGARGAHIFEEEWTRFLDAELGENAPRPQAWKEALARVTLADLRATTQELCSGKMGAYDYFARKELLISACRERGEKAARLAQAFMEGKKKPRAIERALLQAAARFEQAAAWLEGGALPAQTEGTVALNSIPKDWDEQSAEEAKELCRFAAQADPQVQAWLVRVFDLLRDVAERVRARCGEEGILSFDDLIVKTRNLLQSNLSVREQLKHSYDALYIDEFQDTDPVQGELLLFLAERKGGNAHTWREVKLEPGKLFVVGDPKQSIYRFRGADITAYQLFTELILEQGGEKAYLRHNFRSEREIITAVNDICSVVMEEKPAFQPLYEPIFTDKQTLSAAAQLMVIGAPQDKASADDYRHNQARFIANWVRQNVGKMTLANGSKLQYKDIALLSRAATTLGPYADALRRAGIPFSVEEDRDFYTRQEVADFLNFLRAADDPLDRVALAGVMRSPLGGLTDEELYRASRRGEWDYRKPSQEPKLERLFVLLRSFAARAGRQPLHRLQRGLLNETLLREACAEAYDGERSMAHLEKLVSLAEGYSLQTPATLGQFLSRVQELMETELGRLTALPEGEALNALSVMTVHKSKGLEFPVVILADVSKKETDVASKRPMHLYSWRYDLHGLRVGKYADINLAWLEEEQKEHARCEEVRVLYVALTRAREKLIIAGNEQSDAHTVAELLRRAGRFPADGERPEKLGGEAGLFVSYVPYAAPKEFIYLQENPVRENIPQKQDFAAWRAAVQTRQAEYARELNARGPQTPSAHNEPEETDPAATQLGTLVHETLARCWTRPQDGLEACIASCVSESSERAQMVRDVLAPFFASPLFRRLRSMQTLGAELPFSQQTAQGVVSGVIDLLLRGEDGVIWVVDYKTDNISPGTEEASAQKYFAQVQSYVRAARAIYPGADVRGLVVFVRTARGVELSGEEPAEIGKI